MIGWLRAWLRPIKSFVTVWRVNLHLVVVLHSSKRFFVDCAFYFVQKSPIFKQFCGRITMIHQGKNANTHSPTFLRIHFRFQNKKWKIVLLNSAKSNAILGFASRALLYSKHDSDWFYHYFPAEIGWGVFLMIKSREVCGLWLQIFCFYFKSTV